jgi:3-oxoacyl-(acyl-carrier-protein) synthase
MSQAAQSVFVTRMGVVTPFGPGIDRFWRGIVNQEVRVGEYEKFRLRSGSSLSAPMPDEFLADVDARYGGRKNAWAMDAMFAETVGETRLSGRGAVFFSNAYNGDAYREPDVRTREWRVDHWADWLKEKVGADTACSVLTACTAANTAIAIGTEWIAHGHCDWAIVGAMEMLEPEPIMTFEGLRMTSNTGCRPFAADHDGTVLGEGAGMLLLESAEHAAERGASPLAEVAGLSLMTDGGMGKLTEDGSVVRAMMESALEAAGLAPSDLDVINSAATGGAVVDDLEARAIDALFGKARPIVYSVKPLIGQSIGGTAAVEAIAAILSLLRQDVPVALTDPRGRKHTRGGRLETAFNNAIAMTGQMCTIVFRRVQR